MRYLSVFSGVEAATVAWEPLGWTPVAFSEVDKHASEVLAARFPDVPNLGDITKVDWSEFNREHGAIDIVVGGSPCFPAGSLVLCESGFKPIEQVEVGDMVVTHKGRLRRVLHTGSKVSDTIVLKGQGSVGIECTENHPFYSRRKQRVWDSDRRVYLNVHDERSEWREAKDMKGAFWLNVCRVESMEIPPFEQSGRGQRGKGYIEDFEFTPDFFYFVGRWLGDGWANEHRRSGREESLMKRVYLCCSHDEAEYLEKRLGASGLHFGRSDSGSTERFTCSSTQLYDWLVGNFGVHAEGKNIPSWCFGMDEAFRREMLRGYLDADGTRVDNGYKSTTINRKLSLGVKMLAGSLGIATSVTFSVNDCDAVIEGRRVNERPNYVSGHYTNSRSAFFADSGFYGLVRKVGDGRKQVRVYNLEVDDDNSYTVDAIGVHNCQSFSIAGNREGLEGESRLMFEYIRCVREVVPRYFVWENVPGCLSSNKGRDFACLLTELEKCGYGMAWRVFDAQFARVPGGPRLGFFGPVPQRRRRVFLVGSLGTNGAAEILFERSCLRGDYPKGAKAREALAGDVAESVAGHHCAGFKYHQGGKAGTLGYSDDQSPTLTADYHQPAICVQTDHMGQNGKNYSVEIRKTLDIASSTPVMCMSTGQANAEVMDDQSPTLNTAHEQPIVCKTQYGDIAGTLSARADSSPCADRGQNVVCVADDNGKSAVETYMSGSLKVGGGCAVNSSGEEVVGALCARDFKGVGSQYVSEGKVILLKAR